MASGDTIGSADEVAAIIGAPKVATLQALLTALHEQNVDAALTAVATAVSSQVEMKLFARLLLEHIRAVMLVRNQPGNKELILANFGADTATLITTIASGTTHINSHLLLRFLQATEQVNRSRIPQLPLEVAIMELGEK
jgi:DNA polymerase III gamma/tau subunit